jgi:hypothetical protein
MAIHEHLNAIRNLTPASPERELNITLTEAEQILDKHRTAPALTFLSRQA